MPSSVSQVSVVESIGDTHTLSKGDYSPDITVLHSRSAAAPLVVEEAALLHARHTNVLPPLAAVLLALGGVEPAAVAGVVAGGAGLELGHALGGLSGGRGEGAGEGGGEDDGRELHCCDGMVGCQGMGGCSCL